MWVGCLFWCGLVVVQSSVGLYLREAVTDAGDSGSQWSSGATSLLGGKHTEAPSPTPLCSLLQPQLRGQCSLRACPAQLRTSSCVGNGFLQNKAREVMDSTTPPCAELRTGHAWLLSRARRPPWGQPRPPAPGAHSALPPQALTGAMPGPLGMGTPGSSPEGAQLLEAFPAGLRTGS